LTLPYVYDLPLADQLIPVLPADLYGAVPTWRL
jgi:hypothetical protein